LLTAARTNWNFEFARSAKTTKRVQYKFATQQRLDCDL